MAILARLLPDNPVLTKELRVRMRGARAYWILFGYLGILSLLLWFQYYGWVSQVHAAGRGASEASQLGREIYTYLLGTQMFLVLFITPAITSGALTIEKEQRTLDMLTLTRLPRRSIILGKLLSAVLFTALLILSSLPVVSICFMLGSVDPAMVASAYLAMLMGSVLVGALGLMWSAVMKSTTTAVMATYGCLFLLVITGVVSYGTRGGAGGGTGEALVEGGQNALLDSWFGSTFLGMPIIAGAGFGVFCALGAWVLCALAMVRLEVFPERKAGLIRLLAALFVCVEILCIDNGWVRSWYSRGARGGLMVAVCPPVGALAFSALALLLLVPVFGTGEVNPYEARRYLSYWAEGWKPGSLRSGKLQSGLPYMLILTAAILGVYALAFTLAGRTTSISNSNLAALQGRSAPAPPRAAGKAPVLLPGRQGAPVSAVGVPGQHPAADDFPQAAMAIIATVCGLGLLCQLLSVAFRSRWVAWLIATLGIVLLFIVPDVAASSANSRAALGWFDGLLCDLAYLNPVQAILQILDPANYADARWLSFSQPVWQVTSVAWLMIGGLSFALTLPFARREAARQAPIPVEEGAVAP